MIDPDILQYKDLWTRQRKEIALFTVQCYGKTEYLIYHSRSKLISLIASTPTGNKLIDKLISEGVTILEEPPEYAHIYQDQPVSIM